MGKWILYRDDGKNSQLAVEELIKAGIEVEERFEKIRDYDFPTLAQTDRLIWEGLDDIRFFIKSRSEMRPHLKDEQL